MIALVRSDLSWLDSQREIGRVRCSDLVLFAAHVGITNNGVIVDIRDSR